MATLEFENFKFLKKENIVEVEFAKYFFFEIDYSNLTSIDSQVEIEEKKLIFPNTSEKSADNKINKIIDIGLKNLKSKISGKNVLYIDEYSEIPLIGSSEFGIVDRNTNIIELKPITGCNLNCIYCSVNEGNNDNTIDILVDPFYLAKIASQLASQKKHPVEFNINPQGEPLLYNFLEELIIQLKQIPNCKVISINTNGTLLSKKKIDSLISAGLTRINLSLNTLDEETANKMSGKAYPLKHVLEMIKYAQEKNLPVLIAPVIVPTFNDSNIKDIEPLIKLATSLKSEFPKIGFQKFLCNKGGRNPVDEISFEEFFENLQPFEEKYKITLTPKSNYNPFEIYEDKTLEKPFEKNQTIKVEIIGSSRHQGETLAKSQNRIVTIRGAKKIKGSLNVKLVRDKHNIFIGIPLNLT
ncbi:MAG: radical SAM protein [Candidatus Woesearchaeota archaeon]